MDSGRAGGHPSPRERKRITGALDDLVVVALVQANGAVAEHVDGRYHFDSRSEPLSQHVTMIAW